MSSKTVSMLDQFSRKSLKLRPQATIFWISLIVVAISLTLHEPWLDEADAPLKLNFHGWNLWQLMESFRGNGHFPLYHVFLFPLFNVGRLVGIDSFSLVKLFTFIQYSLLAFLVCRWIAFPFSALLLFSYYPAYEYGTISRCYLLALIFLLIIFKDLTSSTKIYPVFRALAYFCFPLTHVLSLIFALPLLAYSLLKRHWMAVSALVASFIICAYYLAIQETDDPFTQFAYLTDQQLTGFEYVSGLFNSILSAWFPFTTQSPWWNYSFAENLSGFSLVVPFFLFLAVVAALIYLYRLYPLLTLSCASGAAGCAIILLIKYYGGSLRHIGYVCWPFLCLIALTLGGDDIGSPQRFTAGASNESNGNEPRSLKLLSRLPVFASVFLLTLNSFFGLAAIAKDMVSPFDSSALQLQLLRDLEAEIGTEPQVFAHPCWSFMQVAVLSNWEYDNSPLWYPEGTGCVGQPGIQQLQEAQYENNVVLTMWGTTIEDENVLPNPALSEQLGLSFGELMEQKGLTCRKQAEFRDVQTVITNVYFCES
ncbi:MAG: hypothetical protein ACFB8W_25525 [Elainellaceae cyanobacterium]